VAALRGATDSFELSDSESKNAVEHAIDTFVVDAVKPADPPNPSKKPDSGHCVGLTDAA
jgi:hypothetical protein